MPDGRPAGTMPGLLAPAALAAALALAAAPSSALAQGAAGTMSTLSSIEGGVTVRVTPKSLDAPDGRWDFAVVLDTHSADLSDDLVQSASLSTDDGRVLKPMGWAGAPPGGHHRSGVLSFQVPPPRPKVVELSITRPGEAAPRTYRWQP